MLRKARLLDQLWHAIPTIRIKLARRCAPQFLASVEVLNGNEDFLTFLERYAVKATFSIARGVGFRKGNDAVFGDYAIRLNDGRDETHDFLRYLVQVGQRVERVVV